MLKVLVYAMPIILGVYALVDCIQTEDTAVRGLPKLGWLVVIAFFWIIGPVAWLIAGRDRGRPRSSTPWPAGPASGTGQQRPSRRVIAPDDDPEFMQQLNRDRERRRREDEARGAKPPDPTPDDTDEGEPEAGEPPRP
jgi:hypothetical protein